MPPRRGVHLAGDPGRRAPPTHQRRERITPVMAILRTPAATATPGRSRSCTTPTPKRDDLPRRTRIDRHAHPNVRVVRSFTTEPAVARWTASDSRTAVNHRTHASETDAACGLLPRMAAANELYKGWRHGPLPSEASTLPQFVAEAGRPRHLRLGATGRDVERCADPAAG